MRWGHIGEPIFRLVVCMAVVFAVTAVLYAVPFRHRDLTSALTLLFVVLTISAAWGFRYALFVALLAALGFGWLLTPVGRFWLNDSRDIFTLAAFLVIGITTSHFSDRARRETLNARRSEKELRDVIETIPAMAFSIRPDGSTKFANRRALEYTGLSADTISEPGWRSTIHRDDLDRHLNKWRASMASGEPFENEVRHRSANGEYRWFLVRAVPLLDERGTILKWYGILMDIEDRKRAEEELHAAMAERARLAAFRDEIGTALAQKDNLKEILQESAKAMVQHLNAAFARIWTVSSDGRELELQASAGMYTHLDGSHSRIPVGQLKIGLIAQERKPHLTNDVQNDPRVSDKDWARREKMISFAGYPLVLEDRVVGVIGMFSRKPLTEGTLETLSFVANGIAQGVDRKRAEESLRRSEKQLRDVIETIPAMAFSIRPDGSTEFVNRRALEYIGLSAETISEPGWQSTVQSTVHPDDLARQENRWRASLASGEPFENEVRHRSANGEYRWFLVRAVPLLDEHGTILKWYGILTDIEDRKRAEALLTGEKRILEMVAKGDSLTQMLDSLCRLVEEQASDVLASIFLVDGNRLRLGGAPSLPKAYTDAFHEVLVGPSVGSCGTAAYRGEQVIVEDVANDPLWADYREVALPHSLRACWSTPIFSSQGRVIATFAMYPRQQRNPSPRDQELIEQITHLAGVAVERKLTQEALRRSEAYLAEAQRLSKTGSWAYNPATEKAIYWSEEMFRMFELDPLQGPPAAETFLQRVHPEDRDSVLEILLKAALEKAEYEHHHRLVLPDGAVKYMHAIGHPVFDHLGEVIEYVGTEEDETERQRAEEALRRSEAYLADAQRLTHTGSWAWSPATCEFLYWSEEMFRIYGFDPHLSPPASEAFWERVHPEDREGMYELMRKAALENTEYEHEHRIVLPDGTVKHIHANGHPVLNRAGDVLEFVGSAVDVTERKHSEDELRSAETRFRAFVDHATDALFVHSGDDQGTIVDVNRQACESLGYTHEELIGKTPRDFDPRANLVFEQPIRGRLEAGETCTFEATHRRKDGTVFPVEVRIRLFWHAGLPFGLSLARDITDRMLAEQERERLLQLETDLAHMNRVSVMGELAASLAHEIKQPIAAAAANVGTYLRWLQRDPPDIAEARQAAVRIAKDVNRAADIIDRNRALYKRDTPKREMVDLNGLIREMVVLLYDATHRHSISIRTVLEPGLATIFADRVQLQQVLMNLMLNGVEAMKDTSGELMVSSSKTEDGLLLVSVSDSGIGLPVEEAERIFEPFFTTKQQGTGMGLSISRRIIESHDGRLWATANSGGGATFHFTLPLAPKSIEMQPERT